MFDKLTMCFCLCEQVPTVAEETMYVRPGGERETREWAENGRIIWEVPRSTIQDKVGRSRVRKSRELYLCLLVLL